MSHHVFDGKMSNAHSALRQDRAPTIGLRSVRSHSPADSLSSVMSALGNFSMQRLFDSGLTDSVPMQIQASLRVGAVDDPQEHEADRVADAVMRMPTPLTEAALEAAPSETRSLASVARTAEDGASSRFKASSATSLVPNQVGDDLHQAFVRDLWCSPAPQRDFDVPANLADSIQDSRGGGSALDNDVRRFMEPRMDADFSSVRVHADATSTSLAHDLSAHAFTTGNDIFFAQGKYSPGSDSGKRLIAHELTHVIQQGAATRSQVERKPVQPAHVVSDLPQAESEDCEIVRRDGGASAIAGLALAGISIVQAQISASKGGLNYSSDMVTYPSGLTNVDGTTPINKQCAYFYGKSTLADVETWFHLHGDFGLGKMANVYVDLERTDEYSISALEFRVAALPTVYGTADDPRLRFNCTGRFDPAGFGDCRFQVLLEVDTRGDLTVVDKKITSGNGDIGNASRFGFYLHA